MKRQAKIEVRMPEELMRQFLYIAEAEHRTPNNQILFLLRNSIQYFERAKGHMDKKKLAMIDISAFTEGETE